MHPPYSLPITSKCIWFDGAPVAASTEWSSTLVPFVHAPSISPAFNLSSSRATYVREVAGVQVASWIDKCGNGFIARAPSLFGKHAGRALAQIGLLPGKSGCGTAK